MADVKLQVRSRDERGGKLARAMRAAGDIPGVLYTSKSGSEGSQAITVGARDLRTAVSGSGGTHAIIDLTIDDAGKTHPVVIKDMQLDPVRDRVIHIDLHEVRADQTVSTRVAIHIEGSAPGVNMGGVLSQPVHEVGIDALISAIPESITIDVGELEINQAIRLGDLTPPEGVTFTDDLESTILATVTVPTVEEEPEEEEGEEGVEGEEGAEGAEGDEGAPAAEDQSGEE
jgi:large subunit ribosomal protein L25